VTAHPKVVEIDKQLALVRKRQREMTARGQAQRAAYDDQLREWRDQHREAVLAGKEPPAKPQEPVPDLETPNVLAQEERRLLDERKKTLGAICPEVLPVLQKLEAERRGKLLAHVQALVEGTEDLRGVLRDAQSMLNVHDPDAARRLNTQPTIVEVLDAVMNGRSLLDLRAPTGPKTVVERVDEPVRLAVQERGNLVTTIGPPPPPPPPPRSNRGREI
jgi:hypothetical protein